MANVKVTDGFDLYASSTDVTSKGPWNAIHSSFSISASAGRWGEGALQLINTSVNNIRSVNYVITDIDDDFIGFGFHFKYSQLPDAVSRLVQIGNSATTTSTLNVNALNMGLEVSTGGDLTLLRDAAVSQNVISNAIIANTWHCIEFMFETDATVGGYSLLLDGAEVASGSADFNGRAAMYFHLTAGRGSGCTTSFDDFYFMQANTDIISLVGNHRIETRLPNANGSEQDLAVTGAASAFEAIDDAIGGSDEDTSYMSSNTVTDTSTFGLQDLSFTPASIESVTVRTEARKTDSGTRTYRHFINDGTGEAAEAAIPLAESYGIHTTVLNQDSTATDWTPTVFNASEYGVEVDG